MKPILSLLLLCLTCQGQTNSATASWSATAQPAGTSYVLVWSEGGGITYRQNVGLSNSCTVSNLTAGTAYTFTLYATNSLTGLATSNEPTVVYWTPEPPPPPPILPSGFSVTNK